MEQITLTVGCGNERPAGSRLSVPVNGSVSAAVAQALEGIPPAVEAWWSQHTWREDYRLKAEWEAAGAIVTDIDYYGEFKADEKTGKSKSNHDCPPPGRRIAFREGIESGEFYANLYHFTPRGARLVTILSRTLTDPGLWQSTAKATSALIEKALKEHGLAAEMVDRKPRHGYAVDVRANYDLARMMYTPTAIVDGVARHGEVIVLRDDPYSPEELVLAAPAEPPRPRPTRTKATAPAEGFEDAVRRWNAAHSEDYPLSVGECPACGHSGCFHALPSDPSKWFCFSSFHGPDSGDCGHETDSGWVGDALDLEAHHSGRTPVEILQRDGYLKAQQAREEPPPHTDEDAGPNGHTRTTEEPPWEDPIPFHSGELARFPVEALPEPIAPFVAALALETQTPPELAAGLALTVAGAALAKKIVLTVQGNWTEPLNIYTIAILASGERKTPVFNAVVEPIKEYERKERARLEPEIAEAKVQRSISEKRLKTLQARAAKDDEAARVDAIALAKELEATETPIEPRYIVDNVTPEKLTSMLAAHGGRMACLSPEGDLFAMIAGRYSKNGASNFDVYIKGHSGDDLTVDRTTRESEYVPKPALSVGITTQPGVVRGLAAHPEFRYQGLIARFLPSWPDSLLGRRTISPPPMPSEVRFAYQNAIMALLALPFGASYEGTPRPHALGLSEEARTILNEMREQMEPQLAKGAGLGAMTDWSGKLAGAVARLAGIMHLVIHRRDGAPWSLPVAEDTMRRAIQLGEYYLSHARRAFSEMGADPATEAARDILAWIVRQAKETFTQRDAHRAVQATFQTAAEVGPALFILRQHGYIREEERDPKHGPGRMASPTFIVNPRIRESA